MITFIYAFVAGLVCRIMHEDKKPLDVPGGKYLAPALILLMACAWPLLIAIALIERLIKWTRS